MREQTQQEQQPKGGEREIVPSEGSAVLRSPRVGGGKRGWKPPIKRNLQQLPLNPAMWNIAPVGTQCASGLSMLLLTE